VRGSNAVSNETICADSDDPLLDRYRPSKILSERAACEFMEKAGGFLLIRCLTPS
jgi:hypothetical protein